MIEYHSRQGALSRVFSWAIVIIMIIGSLELVDQNANYLQVSLFPTAKHAAFDGTVPPIAEVPNWVELNQSQWDKNFSKVKDRIPLPYYDASELATPTSKLKWGNTQHNKIRNAKITYSSPYMSNYKLDGKENVGSHLAIDIKSGINNRVVSIMNCIVTKATKQSVGFGNHVVCKSVNVPSLENEKKKETLYTSYSHMNKIEVVEGQVLKKGQLIGYTGETGTATTPHLHFQIDKASAPWHPYWPFTWKDAQDAGVNFWEGVNIGLGKENALKHTIHPMEYVQKYYNAANVKVDPKEKVEDELKEIPKEKIKEKKSDSVDAEFDLKFTLKKEYEIDDGNVVVILRLFDKKGKVFSDSFDGMIKLSLKDNNSDISKTILEDDNFVKGKTKVTLKQLLPGKTQLIAEYGDKKFYSPTFELKPATTSKTSEGKTNSISDPTGFFNDVSVTHDNYLAIKYLKDNNLVKGYDDGTFKPEKSVSRIEALTIISNALLDADKKVYNAKSLPFTDTPVGVWFSDVVATAVNANLVSGYADLTFRPVQEVNLAEFSKIALGAIDAKIPTELKVDPYSDVSRDLWFAGFIDYAKSKNILDEDRSKIYPGKAMTRANVAEFIFRIRVLDETGARKYDERLHSSVPGLSA